MLLYKDIIKEDNLDLRKRSVDVALPLSEEDEKLMLDMNEYLVNGYDDEFVKTHDIRPGVGIAAPQVDELTGTFSVRAEMTNPDRALLPGQFTKVKLLLDVRENANVVPLKSVDIEKGGAYIYVLRADATVERRFIEIGPEWNNNVVVERGLSAGEFIVTEGYHKLNPGDRVEFHYKK